MQHRHPLLLFTALAMAALLAGCASPSGKQAQSAGAELRNTYWRLTALADQPVEPAEGQPEPHFILAGDGNTMQGADGCNRMMGSYDATEEALSFGPIASTQMFCAAGAEQTLQFLGVLERVNRYRIAGETLTLFDGETPLARFTAVDQR